MMFIKHYAPRGPIRGWELVGGWGVARLGVVGDVVYGGCQPRTEGIDKCK